MASFAAFPVVENAGGGRIFTLREAACVVWRKRNRPAQTLLLFEREMVSRKTQLTVIQKDLIALLQEIFRSPKRWITFLCYYTYSQQELTGNLPKVAQIKFADCRFPRTLANAE